jgi:hypothetical protein
MGSIHEVMEVFREAPSNSERGTKFEKLMVRYFGLGPTAVSAVRRGVVMDRLAGTERQARHRNRPRCPRTGQWRVHGDSAPVAAMRSDCSARCRASRRLVT